MNKLILLTILATLKIPHASAADAKGFEERCAGRDKCVVFYVAPWCGHCKRMLPTLPAVFTAAESKSRPGARILVGAGQPPEENQKLAKEIGPMAKADMNSEFSKKHQIKGYPSFFVFNADGSIFKQGMDAYYWIQKEFDWKWH